VVDKKLQRQGFLNIENQGVYFCNWLFSR